MVTRGDFLSIEAQTRRGGTALAKLISSRSAYSHSFGVSTLGGAQKRSGGNLVASFDNEIVVHEGQSSSGAVAWNPSAGGSSASEPGAPSRRHSGPSARVGALEKGARRRAGPGCGRFSRPPRGFRRGTHQIHVQRPCFRRPGEDRAQSPGRRATEQRRATSRCRAPRRDRPSCVATIRETVQDV